MKPDQEQIDVSWFERLTQHGCDHDQTSLWQLEFHRVLEHLHSLLQTPFAKANSTGLTLSVERPELERQLDEVSQMAALLDNDLYLPFQGYPDIRPHLEEIRPEDSFLEPGALQEIKSALQLMNELCRLLRAHRQETPALQSYLEGIHTHSNIVSEIESTIDRNGEIFDNASPELRRLRKEARRLESEQKRTLKKVQQQYAEFSQDDLVTLRDGRVVLGILPGAVNRVNGIVHGTSASGATVFVEPMETLRIGNEIQNLRIRERTEIIKILRFLTGLVREVRDDILYGLENIARLDAIYAKAKFSRELNGQRPRLSNAGELAIQNGRHPLLIRKIGFHKVVPLEITLGGEATTLVITGPNAGGKTVAMKTIGLLVLMTQLGMLIPADPESRIPVVSRLLVDIGDRQSIEDDLSTFSAHLVRLRTILEKADPDSLVLLDEIGTGTDPREGAALAVAVLSEFTARHILTVATTHHGELKAFAHNEAAVENGSMEFDPETLRPTYRLRMGVPGSSYALEIARRFNFPEHLIQKARQVSGVEKGRLETLILNLEKRIRELEDERRELHTRLTEAEALKRLYERNVADLKAHRAELKRQAAREAREILRNANAVIEKAVQEIRQTQASKSAIKSARSVLREQREQLEALSESPPAAADKPAGWQKGDRVRVTSLGEVGELLSPPDEKGRVRVQVGNVKLTLDARGLVREEGSTPFDPVHRRIAGEQLDRLSEGVKPELDIRGCDSEQAIEETDRYLDQALEQGWKEVRIVHGKGTGVLRRRINEFLSRDKRVAAKRLGKWGEGDTGVTVVTLRQD